MTLRTITFIRHGQSLANVGGVTMEHHAIPLTELGRRQAELLALLLPQEPGDILVSPFERALSTAAPFEARLTRKARIYETLREFETIDPALLEGMTGEQRRPIVEGYWSEADPDRRFGARAETFREFAGRVEAFKVAALPTLSDKTVIFGHGMWMGMLAWYLLGFCAIDKMGMTAFRRFQLGFPMPNGAVYQLQEGASGEWRLQADRSAMHQIAALV